MRRSLSCVLLITLLLTGCRAGGAAESPENLAARIRAEYLSVTAFTAQLDIHVDYGQRVYDFTLDTSWRKDGETVLTVTAPELIAGITARIGKGEALLEYDGASLSTGPLSGDGMTPLEAVPFLMEQVTGGYMARCSFETEGERQVLRVFCRDPNNAEGTGRECALYFDTDSHDLLRAELSYDGAVVLTAALTNFTKEMTNDEAGDDADLG